LLRDACFASLIAIADPDRTASICPEASRSNVAWKTGTSSGHRDAWCAAVTHRFTVVVWLGNATGRSSPALVGADAAAPVALSIIAAIDAVDDAWPATHLPQAPAQFASASESLSILSPTDQSEIVITGEQQKSVELRASTNSKDAIWWFVDGTSIGNGINARWSPIPGKHEIRLLDDAGRSAVARVRVR
jgi:penicillin-binding protein 1C